MAWGKDVRPPVIGVGEHRARKIDISMNEDEIAAMDLMVHRRHCRSRADYVRWLLECDFRGDLMVVDDAFARFCEAIGRGFGGAAAELAAEADNYRLRKLLGKDDD